MSILTTMKGIPLAYNKDMQEDKELTFDAIDTVKGCLALFTGMLSNNEVQQRRMERECKEWIYQCDRCSRLSGKSWSSVPRCTWNCRTSRTVLH